MDTEKILEQLDEEAIADNAQLNTVLKCLTMPLEWLGLESNNSNDNILALTQQLALVRSASWKRHVRHVYKDIVPRWSFALVSGSNKILLDTTLFVQSSQYQIIAVEMARVSLSVLLDCLATTTEVQNSVTLDTLEIYSAALKSISLSKYLYSIYPKYIERNDVMIFCTLLCSIPSRLANTFGIQYEETRLNATDEWYIDRHFYAKASKRLAQHVDFESPLFTQTLLGKIIRQGYEDVAMESVYSVAILSRETLHQWPGILKEVERISSFDQVIRATLRYLYSKQTDESIIGPIAADLAKFLFSKEDAVRIKDFLDVAVFRMTRCSWADDRLARLIVSTAIYAKGLERDNDSDNDESWRLTSDAQRLVLDFAQKVAQAWSDTAFIKRASSRERTYLTIVLLVLTGYLTNDQINRDIMGQTPLMNSVSSYFDSGDAYTAQLGAVVVEAISGKVDGETKLDTGLLSNNKVLSKMKELIYLNDALVQDNTERAHDFEPQSENEESEEEEELDPDADFYSGDDDKSEDDDDEFQAYQMEEESDDEGMKKESFSEKQNKNPVFVRDLIRCLSDQNDPLNLEIGLKAAEQIIRQKAGAGTELSESAEHLAKRLISFPETYEIQDFRQLQQNALTALITAVPETVTGFMIDELYDRNTSNGQRQMILASIALAVRELAGWSDKNDQVVEAQKQLESTTISEKQIGTTVFVSKRMELEKQRTNKIQRNKLSGLAGSIFFFPLLVGWWEGAQGRIKNWLGSNQLLAERFIMTLNIILHSSTNTPDKRRIVKEYFEFILSMRYVANKSVGTKKALLLGIDTIVNTSYKDQEQLLFNDYQRELTETKDWLQEIMENSSESELQEIAVRILMKMSKIALAVTT